MKIQGGLGNQMFQYAAGIGEATRQGTTLGVDLSWFDETTEWWRPYELDKFGVENPPHQGVTEVLEGYFVSDRFMAGAEERVRAAFNFPLTFGVVGGSDVDVCSVHVRRGAAPDFTGEAVADPTTQVLPADYYIEAIDLLADEIGDLRLMVFSDDVDWCRRNLNLEWPTVYPQLSGFEDMGLMTACDHHVVANSSFSWWGAWLANRGITIAPAGTTHVEFPDSWRLI